MTDSCVFRDVAIRQFYTGIEFLDPVVDEPSQYRYLRGIAKAGGFALDLIL